ncbi:MAG: uncharacterized protein V7607_1439 [Solirubrobacteraceae bacterium]
MQNTTYASPNVAPPRHEVEILRDCSIALSDDDAALAADVYLPKGASECPTLVTLLPYHKDGPAGIGAWQAHQYFASRGYACVIVDFRGLAGSSGVARRPFDPGEADDGAAAIAWAADQPWSSGAVGMWGASYGAITAMRTASRRPPALRAIMPVVGHIDHEREFVHPHGVHGCLPSLGAWGLTTLAQRLWPPLHQDVDGRWLERWRRRLEQSEPYLIDLVRRGPGDPSWPSRAVNVSAIEVPTFCVGGWRDLFCEGTLRAYEEITAPKKLLVGPWMHTLPDESPYAPIDFLSIALRWWDRWLRDDRNGIDEEPPVNVYVQGRGTWHQLPAWPPDDAADATFHASADGALAGEAPGVPGERSRSVDPTVGTGSGLWAMPTRAPGLPADQHEDDARSITFTSAPLSSAMEVTGRPQVALGLARAGDGPRTVVVKLACVDPDGRSTLITVGTARVPEDGPDDATLEIQLHATSFEVPAGHRIRLAVAGADFPRLWPDPRRAELAVRCERTSLRLPTRTPRDDVASVPARGRAPANPLIMRAEPVYRVTRDRMRDAVTVDFGDDVVARTVDGEGRTESRRRLQATVAADRPDAARVTGTMTTTIQCPQGEIVVTAKIALRRDLVTASGEVTWSGRQIFSRRWTA